MKVVQGGVDLQGEALWGGGVLLDHRDQRRSWGSHGPGAGRVEQRSDGSAPEVDDSMKVPGQTDLNEGQEKVGGA